VQSGLNLKNSAYNGTARLIRRLALNNEERESRSGIHGTRKRIYLVN
jgi:hypothetical protein